MMPENQYNALCLGGPKAGQFLTHNSPELKVVQVAPPAKGTVVDIRKIPANAKAMSYYFVPMLGLRGFWLWEEETKGRQPFDDIIRLLCDAYIQQKSSPIK